MANENIEFDIIVNGKKAEVNIKKVESAQKKLEVSTKQTTKSMKVSWLAVGAAVASVGLALSKSISEGMAWDKATIGMSKSMKQYAQQMSIVTDLTAEQIAGFARTGQSAGLADNQIKQMIDTAVALGRAYPQESVETFIDNLSMLYSSGEAQGYIVDVLEQKYGALDLKMLSTAEISERLNEVTKGLNEQFENSPVNKLSQIWNAIGVAIDNAGSSIIKFVDKIGVLDYIVNKFEDWGWIQKQVIKTTRETIKTNQELSATVEYQLTLWDKIATGIYKFSLEHKKAIERAKIEEEELAKVGERAMGSLEDTLVGMSQTGKFAFKDMANSILQDLLRIQIRQAIVRPLAGAMGGFDFGSLFSAKGNVFTNGQHQRFAQGGVVNSTKRFAMGGGVGIMGEKGSEAIMPLTRTPSGDLGVKSVGGGGVVINIENRTGTALNENNISEMMQTNQKGESQKVINIVLEGVSKNTSGIRDMLKNMR